MHRKKTPKHKYTSIMLVSTLMLSLIAQTAVPLSVYANQEKEETMTAVNEESSVLSIKEALNLEDNEKETTISGYVVGYILDDKEISRDPGDFSDVNFAIADNIDETDIENMLFVKLSKDFKEEYALSSNTELLDEEITIRGTLGEYLDHAGLVDLTELELTTEEIDIEDTNLDDKDIDMDANVEETEVEVKDVDTETKIDDSDVVVVDLKVDVEETDQPEIAELAEPLAGEEYDLSIMHMNDTHANVENLPYMVSAVNDYRTSNPESLLLHGGDVFSGTLYFNEFKGQADLALMNLMDFDAMVFGNHEFDLGTDESGHPELAEFVDKANFPMLGANINFSEDQAMKKFEPKESAVKDPKHADAYNSIIVERDGEEIGIFGLTTEDTKDIASPINVAFSNYIETAKTEVKNLEDAGINKIIAVTHLGYDSAPAVGNDLLLAENVDGIDVIVGGHSHTAVEPPTLVEKENKAPTVVVQAGQYAEHLGTLEVSFNGDGEIVDHTGELIEVTPDRDGVERYPADEEAVKVLAPYKEQVDKVSLEEIGAVAQKDLVNPRHGDDSDVSVRANETELGNLVTDAMLAKSKEKEPDTVIALQNGGGIRNSIDKGQITVGEVISVLPFGNNPVVAELSGLEIKTILEHAVRNAPEENGGFLHISGMKYYYDSEKEVGNRVVKMVLLEDDKETEIDPEGNRTYKITTNGFTGQGGDGFETFAKAYEDGRVKDIGEVDWQQLVDYMAEEEYLNGMVDPQLESRITDLKGDAVPEEPEDQTEAKKVAEVVDKLISELPKVSELTLADKEKVNAVRKAYDNLSDEAKEFIQNLMDLEAREARLAELAKGPVGPTGPQGPVGPTGPQGPVGPLPQTSGGVKDLIDGIPKSSEVTLDDKKQIDAVRKVYDALTDEEKKLVTNLGDLEASEARIAELEKDKLPQTGEASNKAPVIIGLIVVLAGTGMLVTTVRKKEEAE